MYIYTLALITDANDGCIYGCKNTYACTTLDNIFKAICKIENFDKFVLVDEYIEEDEEDEEDKEDKEYLENQIVLSNDDFNSMKSWLINEYQLDTESPSCKEMIYDSCSKKDNHEKILYIRLSPSC